MTFPCRRVVNDLRAQNSNLLIENEALSESLSEFMDALKAFRRDVLAELAALSERLCALENYRDMDSDGSYE